MWRIRNTIRTTQIRKFEKNVENVFRDITDDV